MTQSTNDTTTFLTNESEHEAPSYPALRLSRTVMALLAVTVLLAAGALIGCGDGEQGRPVAEHGDEIDAHEDDHGEDGDHEGHDHGAEGSDLDRPISELLAEHCEHDMPAFECVECRYEVGIVHAGDELFDKTGCGVLESQRVSRGTAIQVREVPGEVALDGNRTVEVAPLAEGVVISVAVDLGERVRRGQTLLELECPAFREAVAELDRATTAQAAAVADAARKEELFSRKICPEKDLLAARADLAAVRSERRSVEARLLALGVRSSELENLASGGDPGRLAIRAPIGGEIVKRSASRGSRVSPGDVLLVVSNTERMWVMAQLHEADLAAVVAANGSGPVPAQVEVGAWPSKVFQGRVERMTGTLDPVTRTAQARVVVDEHEGLLRSGMFAQVGLVLPAEGDAIVVPRDAVVSDAGRQFSFVHIEGPYWVRRPVKVGVAAGELIEIVDGLNAGDLIVTTGAFLLKSDVLRSKMGAGCAD